MRLAYLYSRYPAPSQTSCDTEMLEIERRGWSLLVASVHPPLTSVRHAFAQRLQAPIQYAPPEPVMRQWEEEAKADGRWPAKLIGEHERKYGLDAEPAVRARDASYFAEVFRRAGVQHFHVPSSQRAAHTALFVKEITGLRFSATVRDEDFSGDAELLAEVCDAAEFVAVETEFSRGLLASRYPAAASKFHRVYSGIDLAAFPAAAFPMYSQGPVRILSVGQLVESNGFAHLIAACAQLRSRGLDFTCEIIGDGPLRDQLQARIIEENLAPVVTLTGALPHEMIVDKLRSFDMFALAPVLDQSGRSNVLPTAVLEAMASSRAVVTTELAGIPEAVIHCVTGLLAAPGDSLAFANLLDRLIRDQWFRTELGNAGRARVAEQFEVTNTVAPLLDLFENIATDFASPPSNVAAIADGQRVGYLIDRWPDPELPLLETELLEMEKLGVPIVPFVCDFSPQEPLTPAREQVMTRLVFLPDAIVIEAEWQQNRALAGDLEEDRAKEKHAAPSSIFLQQARSAVTVRRLLQQHNISHLHATSSRALICGVMLKKLTGLTLSATIETNPPLQVRVLRSALAHCEGGRVSDQKLSAHLNTSFVLEPTASSTLLPKFGVGSKRHSTVWQKWSDLLEGWRSSR